MSNKPVFWKQANGKLVSVDLMDTNHTKNVLKHIINNAKHTKVYEAIDIDGNKILIKAHLNSPKVKGDIKLNDDMANEFNDSYFEDECDATEIDIY